MYREPVEEEEEPSSPPVEAEAHILVCRRIGFDGRMEG